MVDETVGRRIDEWEAAGVIDATTATRLREAERDRAPTAPVAPPAASTANAWALPPGSTGGPPQAPTQAWQQQQQSVTREPAITVTEVFAYLGIGFALAAWYAFVAQLGIEDGAPYGAATMAAAGALVAGAVLVQGRSPRARRGAGVALLVAVPHIATGTWLLLDGVAGLTASEPVLLLLAASAALAAALAFRAIVPAITTQLGVGLAAVSTAAAGLQTVEWAILPGRAAATYPAQVDQATEIAIAVGTIAWWIAASVAMAVVLVLRPGGEPGRERRANVGRLLVGLTLVGGVSMGAMATYPWWSETLGGAVLPPVIGAAIIAGAGAVLIGLALRTTATAYLWPGGLAIWVALTYLNGSYLVDATGLWVALLVEAGLLLGIGAGLRRLRGEIRREGPPLAAGAPA